MEKRKNILPIIYNTKHTNLVHIRNSNACYCSNKNYGNLWAKISITYSSHFHHTYSDYINGQWEASFESNQEADGINFSLHAFTLAIQNNQQISVSALNQFVNLNYPKFIANPQNPFQPAPQPTTINHSIIGNIFTNNRYRFQTFYHPQIRHFKQLAWHKGMDGLMQLENQNQLDTMHFQQTYQPSSLVHPSYPKNNVQFDLSDPYAHYNWELFFHIPMFIANQLSNNLKFEEARKWYHYIFNPMSNVGLGGAPITDNRRFWKFYPFYEQAGQSAQTLSDLMIAIHQNMNTATAQVQQWENHPFQPYVIARMRTWAFMKNVLMKYLDNLIAWADHLFKII